MTPQLSIIVVTYNSAPHIGACCHALQQLHAEPSHEIVVVDNASSDNTVALVQQHIPHVRLLLQNENMGFAAAVNAGVKTAQGAVIALLNPDAQPQPDWGYHLVQGLMDPAVGVVGGKVLGLAGRLQSVGGILDERLVLPAYRGEGEVDHGQYDQPIDVWSAHGASMSFPRQVYEVVGGFDPGYFPAYLEESDFCERVRQAGYRVITAPQAIITHAESAATGKGSAEFYFYFHRNRLRYATRWRPWSALWNDFRPAEYARLNGAPLLDRRVARLVYEAGVPPITPPTADERRAILATGHALRGGTLPDDGLDPLLSLLIEVHGKSVLHPVTFRSRLPAIAAIRTAWNNISTRWYVRPSLDQQSQWNLAIERTLRQLVAQTATRAAGDALATALLAWRIATGG